MGMQNRSISAQCGAEAFETNAAKSSRRNAIESLERCLIRYLYEIGEGFYPAELAPRARLWRHELLRILQHGVEKMTVIDRLELLPAFEFWRAHNLCAPEEIVMMQYHDGSYRIPKACLRMRE